MLSVTVTKLLLYEIEIIFTSSLNVGDVQLDIYAQVSKDVELKLVAQFVASLVILIFNRFSNGVQFQA